MATYTIEADMEFNEADADSLEFATEDLEDIEAESMESISLEDVKPESVAESLESLMEGAEGAEANGYGYTRPSPTSYVNKQLLKTFTIIVKKLVRKIISCPRTRAKLQAVTRKGPTAVAQLLTPSVAKVLPSYFRWMAPIYVPYVTLALFVPICKQVGVKVEEVEELEAVEKRRRPRITSGGITNVLTGVDIVTNLITNFVPKPGQK